MKFRLPFLGISLLLTYSLLFPSLADACGQKFLVAGSSGPFSAFQKVTNPSSILIFRGGEQEATSALWDPALESTLVQAGHKVKIAEGEDQLYAALGGQTFDMVMMDLKNAEALHEKVSAKAPGTSILPSLVFPTRSTFSQAKRTYGAALKTPTTVTTLLSVVGKVGAAGTRS